jgi:hypothetical protein
MVDMGLGLGGEVVGGVVQYGSETDNFKVSRMVRQTGEDRGMIERM